MITLTNVVLRSLLVCAIVLLVLGALGAAWATPTNPYTSVLSGDLGSFELVALVTQNGAMYHYEYTFTFSGATRPLTSFSVGNVSNLPFYDAGNDQTAYFSTNPVHVAGDPNQNSVLWNASAPMPAPKVIKFWFDSPVTYDLVMGSATGGGRIATGDTIGLVPEPASLMMLAACVSGLGASLARRNRRRG